MKNGVPFDLAFAMDGAWADAFGIVFGEFEGATWDWSAMAWERQR